MSSDDTRGRLLETAWRMMREDPHGASMARIAGEAGVSRQAVYLHFHSRAGLLLALVRWIDDREQVRARFIEASKLATPLLILEADIRSWLDYLPRLHPVAIFMASHRGDPEAQAAWNDRMSELEKVFRAPLSALHRSGRLRAGVSVEKGVALVRAVASIHTWHYLVQECGYEQRDAVENILSAVRGALLGADSTKSPLQRRSSANAAVRKAEPSKPRRKVEAGRRGRS